MDTAALRGKAVLVQFFASGAAHAAPKRPTCWRSIRNMPATASRSSR